MDAGTGDVIVGVPSEFRTQPTRTPVTQTVVVTATLYQSSSTMSPVETTISVSITPSSPPGDFITSPSSPVAATSDAPTPTTHTIRVAASGDTFDPDSTDAKVGDVIEFRFYPPSEHWVIRGDFDNPCVPYEYIDSHRTGFSSGPMRTNNKNNTPLYQVTVNDTDPIFYYCGAPGSCVDNHMMGVVNPSKNETFDAWVEKANNVAFQLRPGDPWPSEQTAPKPTPTETHAASQDTQPNGHLSTGSIAGIVLGAVAVLAMVLVLLCWCGRKRLQGIYQKRTKGFPSQPNEKGQMEDGMFSPPTKSSPATPQDQVWYAEVPQGQTHQSTISEMPATTRHSPIWCPNDQITPAQQQGFYGPKFQPSASSATYQGITQSATPDIMPTQDPVELPTSADPGNSPLPAYRADDGSHFSWSAPESAYQPIKQ